MDLTQSLINAALLVLVGVVLNHVMRDRFRQQEELSKTRYEALRAHVDSNFEALRAHIDSRFESVDRHQASVRSDLTQIALAMGAQSRPQAG